MLERTVELKPLNQAPPPLESLEPIQPDVRLENNSNYVNAYENLSLKQNNDRLMSLSASRERLERLGASIERTIIFPENLVEVRAKIDEILKWPEGIGGNIDIEMGDKFVWNKESGVMTLMNVQGGMKFGIRLIPETPEEFKQNQQLATDMQEKYSSADHSSENNRESIENSGKVLGDWIVRRGPWPGRNNSCGASCGSLLNQFGFRKILPQSGRDGKNWDTIIERHASQYFTKIPVSHPNDAPAGSILVFNENARLWTSKRREYGHVEIKGSDGMFYSYYKSVNAAGSSQTNEKNPEKYKRLTGFTGYAYVYNGKKPPR